MKGLYAILPAALLLLSRCVSAPVPAPQVVEQPPTVQVQEDDVWTLLEKGEIEKARALFRGKVDVNSVDSRGRTPLHRAAELRDGALASFFIALGANIDAQDSDGRTPLEIACTLGDSKTAAVLSAGRADIFKSSKGGISPAERGLSSGSPLLDALLTKETLKMTDGSGKTILHLAAGRGAHGAVRTILAKGGIPNHRDGDGKTALDHAYVNPESYDHALTAEALVQGGGVSSIGGFEYFAPAVRSSNYNIRFADGLAPLHFAARSGHAGFVEHILRRGGEVDAKNASGTSALHEAARYGQIGVMRLLLSNGAAPNARDAKGNSALHIVMPLGSREAGIELLLGAGANPNIKDDHGDTPLHIAVSLNLGMNPVRSLLLGGADVTVRNTEGQTALHRAVETARRDYIPLLLEYQADIFAADTQGRTPFDIALTKNRDALTAMITEKTVALSDNTGNTLLHLTVKAGAPLSSAVLILDRKGNPNARNKVGDTPLHLAVRQNEREMGVLLISRGADIFAPNAEGHSPLFLAAHAVPPPWDWILNQTTLEARDGLGNSLLHYAAQWKLAAAIPVIVSRGASTEAKNATGETAIFFAVRADSPPTIAALVTAGASLGARDSLGNSALHTAVRWNALSSAEALLKAGSEIQARNLAGKSPLHEAVRLGMVAIEGRLIQSGAALESRDLEGNTPLMEAAVASLPGAVERLAEWGADPTARNSLGNTPLHLAVALGRKDVAIQLLNRGVSIHARNSAGRTPFQTALGTSPDMAATLLTKERLQMSDDDGRSPLHIAVAERVGAEMVQAILRQGGRVGVTDAAGKTPLRMAVDLEAWDQVRLLVDAGADVFAQGADGDSPGTVALAKGETAIRSLFGGKNIGERDTVGNTILHYAAHRGSPRTVALLLELGAAKNARNVAGETPADLAKRWGKAEQEALLK